ncbi:MAG: hypothetical protein U0637_15650 [Phycisphaerales bacterium]
MLFESHRLLKGDQIEGGAGAGNPGGEEVADVLKEFEHGLASLRSLYQQRQSLQQALKQRETDLHQKDQALAARDEALRQRDGQLADRTRELESLTAQFDQKVREFEHSQRSIADREAAMADKMTLLATRQQELATRAEQMTRDAEAQAALALEHEESVHLANAEIERIREEIRAQRASLEARADELDTLSRELATRKAELDEQARRVAVDREAVAQERARCEQLAEDARLLAGRNSELEAQLRAMQDRLVSLEQGAKREAEAGAAARGRAEEFEAQLASLWKAMEEEQESAAKAADAAKRKLEAVRLESEQRLQHELARHAEQAAAETQRALQDVVRQRDTAVAEAEQRAAAQAQQASQDLSRQHERALIEVERQWKQRLDEGLTREREAAAGAVRGAEERLAAQRADFDARLTKELEAQQRELAGASEQGVSLALEQARARMDEEWRQRAAAERTQLEAEHKEQLQQIAGEARGRLAQIEARYQQELEEQLARARTEGATAGQGQADSSWQERMADALTQERVRLAARLADAVSMAAPPRGGEGAATEALEALRAAAASGDTDGTITALEATVRHAFADRADMEGRLTETRGYLDEAADIIRSLESQLQQQRAARRAVAEGGEATVDPEFFITMETRRRRLRLMHTMLRDRTDKVRKASEALRTRFEQCEGVLKQRAELAAAKERIVEAEKRVQRSSSRSRAAVVMLCAVASMGVIGGLSWALARQVAPATFLATAELSADGRGRTLQPGELDEWQNYHEKLLADPRFHQMAAERFQRLGMATLGTPMDVKRFVDEKLRYESMNPGQMSLHLEGQGAKNTERTLNTFAAAFASHANAAQTARTDGSVTRVTQEARTGDDPIDNTRTYWALGMMGIATSVCFVVAAALWKKLAGAKTAFEQDTQISAILDESRWGVQVDTDIEKSPQKAKKAA